MRKLIKFYNSSLRTMMTFIAMGCVGILISQSADAASAAVDTALEPMPDLQLPFLKVATPKLNDVLQAIAQSRDKGQEDMAATLRMLSVRFPEYFDFFLLNYASRSLHQSSYKFPRVILHGDGSTFLAFNGESSQRGFANLEVMEFKGVQGYEFRSIQFLTDGTSSNIAPDEIETTIGSVLISKANPRVCLKCHGQRPRPIFDAYPIWPGFYGADEDGLFQYGRAKSNYASFEGEDFETPAWKAFKQSYQKIDRYRMLKGQLTRHNWLPEIRDRINLNVNKIFSYQMSAPILVGLEQNEEALETIGAIAGCRQYLWPEQEYAQTLSLLQKNLDRQREFFKMTAGSYSSFSARAVDFMAGPKFASKMTSYERAVFKYAHLDLRQLSYSRNRDLDLQDGGGGLRDLSTMARSLLKKNFAHDVDFHRCDQILGRLEKRPPLF